VVPYLRAKKGIKKGASCFEPKEKKKKKKKKKKEGSFMAVVK
jgi:hypothetical protein